MGWFKSGKSRHQGKQKPPGAIRRRLGGKTIQSARRHRPLYIEWLEDRRLMAVQPFPVPLEPLAPSGSLVFQSRTDAVIDTANEVESFTIELDGGQSLSIAVDPSPTLLANIEVRDPSNAVIGAATSNGLGLEAILQSISTTVPGTYTVNVTSASNTIGGFAIDLLVNAEFEVESQGGTKNNSPATAQDINSSFVSFGVGNSSRGAVLGSSDTFVDEETFESGALGGQWTTSSSQPGGRIQVSGEHGVAEGSYALLMDRNPSGTFNLNEAVWTVDLSGLTDATLSFSHADFGDEQANLPTSFIGSASGDGVAISADGINWRTVLNATNVPNGIWAPVSIDLAAAAAAAGMSVGSDFKIKFQQYDEFNLPSDGRGYDDIRITTNSPEADWFRFDLDDGESVSFALTKQSEGSIELALFASDGTTQLAAAVDAANLTQVINNFVDPHGGAAQSTYFVRVVSSSAEYSLVVTRDADFDSEPNNSFSNAQDISDMRGVLGHVLGSQLEPTDDDWYRFGVTSGEVLTIRSTLPGDGPFEFHNPIAEDPSRALLQVELYDPTGNLVVSADDEIVHSAGVSGEYRLHVFALDLQGEYFIDVSGATGLNPAPSVVDANPDIGSSTATFPTVITLEFSETLLATSIQASDLLFGGFPALSVNVVDGSTLEFTIDPAADLGDGAYSLALAAGAVSDLQGIGSAAFNGSIVVDRTGPVITGTLWNGAAFTGTVDAGSLTFEASFNEDLYSSSGADDIVVQNISTGQFFTATTVDYSPVSDKFTAGFDDLVEGEYVLTLISGDGAFEDAVGNALDGEPLGGGADGAPTGDGIVGGDYVVNFVVDRITPAPPEKFERVDPLGSLIFRGEETDGLLHIATDTDDFRFELQNGQTVSAILVPNNPAATLSLELVGLGSPIVATAPGQAVVLPASLIAVTGPYALRVGGDVASSFSLEILLNASTERLVGDTADGSELAIDDSFVDLGSGRFAVVGESNVQIIPVGPGRLFAVPLDGSNDIVELSPSDGSELNRFDAPELVGPGASVGLAYDGELLYFSNASGSGALFELDPETGAMIEVHAFGGSGLAAVAGRIYISNAVTDDIYEFDPVADVLKRVLNFDLLNGLGLSQGMAGVSGLNALLVQTDNGQVVEVDPLSGMMVGGGFASEGSVGGAAVVGGQIYLGDRLNGREIAVYERNGTYVRSMNLPYPVAALGGDDLLRASMGGDLISEPNDTIATAESSGIVNAIGNFSSSGRIGDNPNLVANPGRDVDLVRVDLLAGHQIVVDIDASQFGSSLDPVLTLFNASGAIIAQNDDFNSTDSFLNVAIATSGAYYVGVSGSSNFGYNPNVAGSGTKGSVGRYDLRIDVSRNLVSESNDTIATAVPSGIGGSTTSFTSTGRIDDNPNLGGNPGLDVDLIAVALSAGDQVTVDINAAQFGSTLDSILTLFNSAGVIIAQNDDFNGLDSFLDVTVTSSDTYYVGVSGYSNFGYNPHVEGSGSPGSTGAYNIIIGATFADPEPGNPVAIIPDVDEYTIDLTGFAGSTLDIALTGLSARLSNETLELLAPDGTTVLGTGVSSPLGVPSSNVDLAILNFEVPSDGIYTVRISSEVTANYTLLVTQDLVFDTEPNGSSSNPLRPLDLGDTALGFIGNDSDAVGRLFGVDSITSEIVEFDPATGMEVNRFNLPEAASGGPDGLAFNGASLFYAEGSSFGGSGILYELDPDSGSVLDSDTFISLGLTGGIDSLGAYGGRVIASDTNSGALFYIDTAADTVAGNITKAVVTRGGLTGAGGRGTIFANDFFGDFIFELDPATGNVVNVLPAPSDNIYGLAMVGESLVVGDIVSGQVMVLDPDTGAVINAFSTGVPLSALGGDDASGTAPFSVPGSKSLVAHEKAHDYTGLTVGQIASLAPAALTAYRPQGVSLGELAAQLNPNGVVISDYFSLPTDSSGSGSLLEVDETEPNNTPGTSTLIPLGFDADEDPLIKVSGALAPVGAPIPILTSENDGAIPLATATGLTTGNLVVAAATIGDGPFGGTSGDYDWYSIAGVASGQEITVDIDAASIGSSFDSIVGIYDSAGNLLAANDQANGNDSYLAFSAPAAGDYYVVVFGYPAGFQVSPFDSSSGTGVGTIGFYEVRIGLEATDVDYYRVTLAAGDILGANVAGAGTSITMLDATSTLLMRSQQDVTFIHPISSPLPGGGNAALSWVASEAGDYYVAVRGGVGAYNLDLQVFRPALEREVFGTHQILFLDFDGATINRQLFAGSGNATLSPLSNFLAGWGLNAADEDAVIDAIVASVQENLSEDLRALGNNGDFDLSGINGQFDIEILNSRDHADPFGLPNVSRIVIGGTIDELGISTIGIAETIDVGNFDTSESAVVLLDLLSAPSFDPNSLNQFTRAPGVSIIDLIGVGVGNITSHEAGHFFANWHTNQFNSPPNIMDQGGHLANTVGLVGAIWGDGDEFDVDLGPDTFVANEGFAGTEDTLNSVAFGLSTGILDPILFGPTVTSIDPPAGDVEDLSIRDISILFNEPITAASANNLANYQLIDAGLNGMFEGGSGDDGLVPFSIVFDGVAAVDLVIGGGPLKVGSYQLTIDGDSSIVDLDGNPLNSTTGHVGGSDFIHQFDVVFNIPAGGDLFELTLSADQAVSISTSLPLGGLGGPLNSLNPEIRIYGTDGLPLVSDLDSADGRNASLTFIAPTSGSYLIHVLATDGEGEYLLHVDAATLPLLVGDYNRDGAVNIADYAVWRDNLGSPDSLWNDPTPEVTLGDHDAWAANFGATYGSGSAALQQTPFTQISSQALSAETVDEAFAIDQTPAARMKIAVSSSSGVQVASSKGRRDAPPRPRAAMSGNVEAVHRGVWDLLLLSMSDSRWQGSESIDETDRRSKRDVEWCFESLNPKARSIELATLDSAFAAWEVA